MDTPYALAVGGSKNGFQVMDVRQLQPGLGRRHDPRIWWIFFVLSLAVAQRFHGRDLIVPVLPEESTTGGGREGEATEVGREGMKIPVSYHVH